MKKGVNNEVLDLWEYCLYYQEHYNIPYAGVLGYGRHKRTIRAILHSVPYGLRNRRNIK